MRGVLAFCRDPALADAGTGENPLVARIDPLGEFIIGHHRFRQVASRACNAYLIIRRRLAHVPLALNRHAAQTSANFPRSVPCWRGFRPEMLFGTDDLDGKICGGVHQVLFDDRLKPAQKPDAVCHVDCGSMCEQFAFADSIGKTQPHPHDPRRIRFLHARRVDPTIRHMALLATRRSAPLGWSQRQAHPAKVRRDRCSHFTIPDSPHQLPRLIPHIDHHRMQGGGKRTRPTLNSSTTRTTTSGAGTTARSS